MPTLCPCHSVLGINPTEIHPAAHSRMCMYHNIHKFATHNNPKAETLPIPPIMEWTHSDIFLPWNIHSSEQERPVWGTPADEFHTHNVRKKKAHTRAWVHLHEVQNICKKFIGGARSPNSGHLWGGLWQARSRGGFGDGATTPVFFFFHVGRGYLMWSHKNSLSCTNTICAHFWICVILQIKVKEEDQGSVPSSATDRVTCGIHFSFMLQPFHLRNQRTTTHLWRCCKNRIRGCT